MNRDMQEFNFVGARSEVLSYNCFAVAAYCDYTTACISMRGPWGDDDY